VVVVVIEVEVAEEGAVADWRSCSPIGVVTV
jgi:hypothetical protein